MSKPRQRQDREEADAGTGGIPGQKAESSAEKTKCAGVLLYDERVERVGEYAVRCSWIHDDLLRSPYLSAHATFTRGSSDFLPFASHQPEVQFVSQHYISTLILETCPSHRIA